MTPNGTSYANDATWLKDAGVILANRPELGSLLQLPITNGRAEKIARRDSKDLTDRLVAIASGFASDEIEDIEPRKSWANDRLNFGAESGMIAGLEEKTKIVSPEIFHGTLRDGFTMSPAALEPWRSFSIQTSRLPLHRPAIGR